MLLLVENHWLYCVKDHVLILCNALWDIVDDSFKALIETFDVLWTAIHAITTYRVWDSSCDTETGATTLKTYLVKNWWNDQWKELDTVFADSLDYGSDTLKNKFMVINKCLVIQDLDKLFNSNHWKLVILSYVWLLYVIFFKVAL